MYERLAWREDGSAFDELGMECRACCRHYVVSHSVDGEAHALMLVVCWMSECAVEVAAPTERAWCFRRCVFFSRSGKGVFVVVLVSMVI